MSLRMLGLLEYILYNTYIYELFGLFLFVVCLFFKLSLVLSHAPGPLVSALHSCYFGYPRFRAT